MSAPSGVASLSMICGGSTTHCGDARVRLCVQAWELGCCEEG